MKSKCSKTNVIRKSLNKNSKPYIADPYVAVKDIPMKVRYIFSAQESFIVDSPSLGYVQNGYSAAQPFKDVAGVRTYPAMYEDLTNIHVRYRVTKVRVRATFHSESGSV
jgi:hypothetical protein